MTQNRIKKLRLMAGLSQAQLANKIGASNQAISFYENNKRDPKIETWQALANFFNVSVPYLQGIDDKPNTGYSKDYIYKLLDAMYKEPYRYYEDMGFPHSNTFIDAKDEIEDYCENKKISIPKDVGLDFWQKYFSFIFKDKSVKRLLTTKDKYSDSDIKELILDAIFNYANPDIVELVKKMKHSRNNHNN